MGRAARILLVLLAPQFAPLSIAFKVETHQSITLAELSGMSPPFSAGYIEEINSANACVDLGIELFTKGDQLDKPCSPGALGGVRNIEQQLGSPEDHFDDEKLIEGMERVRKLKKLVVLFAGQGRYVQARKAMGMALHTLQDFYSHSNWIELGNKNIFSVMDTDGGYIRMPVNPAGDSDSSSIRLAGSKEDVCKSTQSVSLGAKMTDTGTLIPATSIAGNGKPGYVLTTGFYLSGTPGKCRHGGAVDGGADGINKDDLESSHGKTMNPEAQRLAALHTRQFVSDCLNQMDAKAVAGMTGRSEWNCPSPVRQHIHDPNYLDVNARRFNNTGLVVKAGDRVAIEAKPDGLIVWGQTATLFGKDRVASPEGDPGVSPANHFLWIDPPLKDQPIGMLIGTVWPDDTSAPKRAENGMPIDQTGSPAKLLAAFPVGTGGTFTMTAGGMLLLLVNDGQLNNNRGCFQAKVTLIPSRKP
jgi:hypothetical protein